MKRHQSGFTLIELVIVIAILAILAAFALPRYANLTVQARQAVLQGVVGTLNSASAISHSACISSGCTDTTTPIVMEGVNVDMLHEYPDSTATGIGNAMTGNLGTSGNSVTVSYAGASGGTAKFQVNGQTNCEVDYTPPAAANSTPTITIVSNTCT